MPTLAAVVVPVRADVSGLPNEVRNGLTQAFRQSEPAVRQGASRHGQTIGRGISGGASDGLKKGLGQAGDEAGNALTRRLGKAGSDAGGLLQRGLSKGVGGVGGQFEAMAGVATGALGVTTAGIGALVGAAAVMGTKTAASMEQAQIGFSTLLGSGRAAQTFLAQLQQFAAATPFELPGLIQSSRTLIGVGVSAKDTMTILRTFGDTASAVGIDQESFQRIMLATSQAIGAGRFMTADLNQIMNNGIPIWHILSQAMGVPEAQLRKLASQGKLLSSQVLPALERQMQKNYGGAMVRQSQTLNGVWSTFMDTLNIGLSNVIRPLIPAMTVGLTGATNVLSAALTGIPHLFSSVGTSGSFLSTVVANLSQWFRRDLMPAVQGLAAQVLPAFQSALRSVGAAVHDHQEIIQAVALIFQGLGLILTRVLVPALGILLRVVLATIGPAMRISLTFVGVLADAILAIPRVVGALATTGQRIISSLVQGLAANPVAQAIGRVVLAITTPFLTAGRWLLDHGGEIISGLVSGISVQTLSRARDGLAAAVTAVMKAIVTPFANADTALSDAGAGFVRGLAQGMGAATPAAAKQAAATRISIQGALAAPSTAPLTAGLAFGTSYSQGLTTGLVAALGVVHSFAAAQLPHSLSPLPGGMLTAGVRAGAALAAGLRTQIPSAVTVAGALVNAITRPFVSAASWLLTPGTRVVIGLVTGIHNRAPALTAALIVIRQTIITSFLAAPTWLVSSGVRVVAGLLSGTRATAPQVFGYITGTLIRAYIRAPWATAQSWLVASGSRIVQGLVSGIRSVFGAVRSSISTLINNYIRAPFGAAVGWLSNSGYNIIRGLYSGITAALGNVRSWVSSHITTPIINAVRSFFGISSPSTVMAGVGSNLIAGLVQGLVRNNPARFIGKIFGGMPQALGAIVNKGLIAITSLPSKALSALGGLAGKVGGIVGSLFSGGGGGSTTFGGGVSHWSTVVLQALQMLGQPASWLGTVLSRMQRESGGSTTVVNKWDSNWAAGTPSVGLMQVIGPTFDAYAGPFRGTGPFSYGVSTNPLANVYAGLNYALHTYGSLAALSRAGGYDAGGWLPPGGLGMNMTSRPERVLDPQASEAYTRSGGAGNVRVTVMLDGSVIDDRVHVIVEDAVGELGARLDNGI